MLLILYLKLFTRLFFRRIFPTLFVLICIYLLFFYRGNSKKRSYHRFTTSITLKNQCNFKPSTDQFLLNYKPNILIGNQPDSARAEPTTERLRILLEILRSKEDKYQSLLESFDVFNMLNPTETFKAYTNETNIDEIKTLYNRYIKLMSDHKTVEINQTFIDYLKQISSYLSDGLRNKRTAKVIKNEHVS
jgi:hypothetical protein